MSYRGRSSSRPPSSDRRRDYRSPPPRDRSPPPRDRSPPPRDRSPPPRRRDSREPDSGRQGGNKPEQGKYKITVEGIPEDMSWKELKDLGRVAGNSLTFARTFKSGPNYYGMLEFSTKGDAEAAMRELDNRRVEGSKDRLKTHWGDLANDGSLGSYQGRGKYEGGGGRSYSPARDRSPPRRRSPSRRRSPPRRQSRSRSRRRTPPRRGGGGGGGREEIMTLYVKDLPEDARESEVADDLDESAKVLRVMIMRKNNQCSAFVRFGSVKDAERAMDDVLDGAVKVCGRRVQIEMARKNTEVQ